MQKIPNNIVASKNNVHFKGHAAKIIVFIRLLFYDNVLLTLCSIYNGIS